jgi:hypothetical protein
MLRNLQVSVPRDLELRHELQHGRRSEQMFERRMRCVAVVGAGASAPLHRRGAQLAKELVKRETDKHAYDEELSRLHRVYGLDIEDFETKLAALSRTPQTDQRVREHVSREYADRHPTVLGYELLAHLLKHRFLDAVISFNFDELLDQSLDDELGVGGYRRLVSDRDCGEVVHDPDASNYLPLYIKLHGTATEADSLRLTRDAYYRLPQKLMEVVGGLLKSEMTVIVSLGSAMTGFDLHRLLRIPKELEVYDLSFEALSGTVCSEIADERLRAKDDSIFKGERRRKPVFKLLPDELPPKSKRFGCDQWMEALADEIEERSSKGKKADPKDLLSQVRFRSVDRHIAVARLLGEDQTLGRRNDVPERDRDSDYLEYLRRRTIVELAFSGAKARGLAQVSWLAVDRSGAYYDLYRRIGGDKPWSVLRAAAGLDENGWLPDVVESQEDLCGKDPVATRTTDGRWNLRQFDHTALAKHVGAKIGKSGSRDQKILREVLQELQEGSEVEIQATDDQVCSKAFDSPLILPTITALRVFSASLFKDLEPEDEVYISCETGEWLLDDPVTTEKLLRQNTVYVATAFDLKRGDLDEMYEGRLKHKVINPWRHNRHMTVVCSGRAPSRAVYFARRVRSPLITPVYLDKPKDARRVKRTFELMCIEEPGRGKGADWTAGFDAVEESDREMALQAEPLAAVRA